MFVLKFEHRNSGGLGDRIIGIINVLNLSKKFNHEFKIVWDVNVSDYFENTNFIKNDIKEYVKINMFNCNGDKNYETILKKCDNTYFSVNKTYIFQSNIMTSRFLYENPCFLEYSFEKDILNMFDKLYDDILIPTSYLKDTCNMLLKNVKSKIIGVQIRTGDNKFWNELGKKDPDNYNPIKNNEKIVEIIDRLYNHINEKEDNYNIYLTTDNEKVKSEFYSKFKNKTLYYDKNICHIDISHNISNDDLGKLFIDQYIMSKYTNELYISDYSNFGTIIALSSSNNQKIFNLQLKEIEKKSLIYHKQKVPHNI